MKKPQPHAPPASPAQKNRADFTVLQSTLTQALGLTVEEVRELREAHFEKWAEWGYDPGNRVAFTPAAAQKLAALVAAGTTEGRERLLDLLRTRTGMPLPPLVPPEALQTVTARLRVEWAGERIKNPRLLQARLEEANTLHAADTLVTVWVRDNKQFRPGELIAARHRQGLAYDFTSKNVAALQMLK